MGIAADVVTGIVDPIDKFITSGVSTLAGQLAGPLKTGATLYIAIFGILIVLGYVRSPVQDFLINALKIIFIMMLVTQVDQYNFYVKDFFFTKLPEGLSQAIGNIGTGKVSASGVSNGSAFDAMLNQIISISDNIRKNGSWRNIYPIAVAVTFSFISLIVSLILMAVVLYAKVALGLLLVIGPIFICLLLFRVTQPFFSSWLAGVVNFVVLQVLVMVLITLLMSIIKTSLDQASGANYAVQMVMVWRMLGLFALGLYIALQLPDIAARISGGGLALGGGITSSAYKGGGKLAALAFNKLRNRGGSQGGSAQNTTG